MKQSASYELSVPQFFNPDDLKELRAVKYEEIALKARAWQSANNIPPSAKDRFRICLMPIDVQLTFCHPDFELFVGGRSGMGAIDDNVRLCEFIYRNLSVITEIDPTMDTHTAMQIFHQAFWINDQGENPPPMTVIELQDVEKGVWKVNPAVAFSIVNGNYIALKQYAEHYVRRLSEEGKYPLIIWPYHAMLGGVGHAIVPSVEEAIFFHNLCRMSQTGFEIKGGNPLTENYSVLRPEILDGPGGQAIAQKNARFIKKLLNFDAVIITGQAKSHCVAWTIADLLEEIAVKDPDLAKKVYLMEDCTSSVVVPGVADFTEQGDESFERFAKAGMNIVRSSDEIQNWTGINI